MATMDPERPPVRIGGWIPPYNAASPVFVPPPDLDDPGAPTVVMPFPVTGIDRGTRATWTLVIAGLAAVLALAAVIIVDRSTGTDHRAADTTAPAPPIRFPDEAVPIPIPVLSSAAPAPATSRPTTRTDPAGPAGARHPRPSSTHARPNVPARPALTPGHRVSLQPAGLPAFRVRHRNFQARVDRIGVASPPTDRADATFIVRNGLADPGCVSFEATNYPGRYLRHQNFALYLHIRDGSPLFAADSTFCPVTVGGATVLRSRNYPDRYVVQLGSLLFLQRVAAGQAMSLVVRPPL